MGSYNAQPWLRLWTAITILCTLLTFVHAQAQPTVYDGHLMIPYTNDQGTTQWFTDDRQPSLYTQTFGDCQGDSLLNLTRFDAAYYKDNMTVLFHLEGASALANESVIRKSTHFLSRLSALLADQCSLHRRLCIWRASVQLNF